MESSLGAISFGSEIKSKDNKSQRKRSRQSANIDQLDSTSLEPKPNAAWIDNDDQELVIDTSDQPITKKLRQKKKNPKMSGKEFEDKLRKQFEAINPVPGWVNAPTKDVDSDNEVEDLLTSAGPLVRKSAQLPEKILKYDSLGILNPRISSKSVSSLQFHADGELCLIAGGNTVKFFNMRGKKNKEIIKIPLKGPKGDGLVIKKAQLFNRGTEVVLLSSLPVFHTIDLSTGNIHDQFSLQKEIAPKDLLDVLVSPELLFIFARGGRIFGLDPNSKHLVCELRATSQPTSYCLSPDNKYLYTAGTEGIISQWDVSARKTIHHYTDEGSLHTTALTVSSDGRYQVAGSSSGIVNVYDLNAITEKQLDAPTPIKRIENLVTRVDKVLFNPTDQFLTVSSETGVKNNRLRFAHVPSWKIFPNFPGTHQLSAGKIYDFSPNSGLFAAANGNKVQLFRLNHFRSI